MSAKRSPRNSSLNIASVNVRLGVEDQTKSTIASQLRPPRITPRNSIATEAVAEAAKETPYETLKQLANIPLPNIPKPSTPLRRSSSAGPPSTRRSARQTPAALIRTPGTIQRLGSAKRQNALTPHARAAIREIELRRAAALTPGKDRRRSGLQQRETPREFLRQLSKVLAPVTKPIEASPAVQALSEGKIALAGDDLDDGEDIPRPRLSMPLGDEDDDSLLDPPRLSLGFANDENITQQSVELPRRANSEQPGSRLSRGSFGSIRASDRFGDLSEIGLETLGAEGFDPSYIQENFDDDYGIAAAGEPSMLRELTDDQRRTFPDDGNRPELAATRRTSDLQPILVAEDDTETTFQFMIPARNSPTRRSSLGETREFDIDEQEEDENVDEEPRDVDEREKQETDLINVDMDISMQNPSILEMQSSARIRKKNSKSKRSIRVSRHGIQYSSLPEAVVKKLATTFLRTSGSSKVKISKDALDAIMQASDWFFEQVSDDLGAYAEHAGRKTIDENDVVTLMKRQRQINATTTPFALAQKYLPRELLQELRMAPPPKLKRGRQLEKIGEDDEDEDE